MQSTWFAISVSIGLALPAASLAQGDPEPVKVKEEQVTVRDKSKPVREALEIQYAKLAEAVEKRDFEAFQALRTDDFHTVDENGLPRTPQQMAERARAMLERIQPPIKTTNTLGTIDVHGDDATVTVRQYFSKMLPVGDRLLHGETYVTQDETLTRTEDGWKLRFVDGVRDPESYVDGKRIDPTKPYDPDAPPYDPKAEGH
jgi:ketosteroid isomerase-like protein